MKRKRIVSMFSVLFALALQVPTAQAQSCSYPVDFDGWYISHYVFTWFAVQNVGGNLQNGEKGEGWETRLKFFNPSTQTISIRYDLYTKAGGGANPSNGLIAAYDGTNNLTQVVVTSYAVDPGTERSTRLLSAASDQNMTPSSDEVDGSIRVAFKAQDCQTMQAIVGKAEEEFIYYMKDPVTGVVAPRWTAKVNPVAEADASNRLFTGISVTPPNKNGGNAAEDAAFAVKNLSSVSQMVTLSLFDSDGKKLASKQELMQPGQAFAQMASSYFGPENFLVGPNMNLFSGKITFESSDKLVLTALHIVGTAGTSSPVWSY